MNILFLSYWGINEGLTSATVIPHIAILAKDIRVKSIVLVTIERGNSVTPDLPEIVTHIPLKSKYYGNVIVTKIVDFIKFPRHIRQICREFAITLIMCRSSLAGALGYLVSRKTRIVYTVESFEPHADYMLQSRVWRRYDPRFLMQRYLEDRQKKTAIFLLPVAKNYEYVLISQGVPVSRIMTMPCCVDTTRFSYSALDRQTIRNELNIETHAITGIYVGKFGGIYYEQQAFDLFQKAWDFFGASFFLILLTDYDRNKLLFELKKRGIDQTRVYIECAPHQRVPLYLSASDFAFTLYKWAPSMKFLSPIKIGEYWANGLPVLIERGVGDDADIIQQEKGGVIYSMQQNEVDFDKLLSLLKKGRKILSEDISKIAIRHRHLSIVVNTYRKILDSVNSSSVTI